MQRNDPSRFASPEYRAVIDEERWPGCVRWPKSVADAIAAHAARGYPREVCGLVLGSIEGENFVVREALEARNRNTERAHDRFELDPKDYRRAEARAAQLGLEIVGVYHSHPDCPAQPSPTDRAFAWDGWLYPIVSVRDGKAIEIRAWVFDEGRGRFREAKIDAV